MLSNTPSIQNTVDTRETPNSVVCSVIVLEACLDDTSEPDFRHFFYSSSSLEMSRITTKPFFCHLFLGPFVSASLLGAFADGGGARSRGECPLQGPLKCMVKKKERREKSGCSACAGR